MARLSPSPSGSRSRRLSELLEEQQEPFSLDLYLLEKGCSPSLLDAASGGATSTCWPRSSSAYPELRPPAASKKTRASGLLRLLLSKILRGTAAAAANQKKLPQPSAIDWGAVDGERQKLPCHFKNAASLSSSPRRLGGAVKVDVDEPEEEDDDDDSKQLSPVSVLEQHPFEQGALAYGQKAVVIFRELLEAAYTPALLDQLAKDSSSTNKSTDGRNDTSATAAPAAPTRTDRTTSAAHWEEMFEAELAKVHGLIASEMAGARVGQEYVRPERRDVGTDVTAAVLEALTEEIAVELMGTDHEDAIDDGRWCWC